MRLLCTILLICGPLYASSQTGATAVLHLADSLEGYPIESFYAAVIRNHPIVKQTRLLSETARQEVRLARGSFDPKLESKLSVKEFNDKEYYNKWITSLSIPVWIPIDPKIGLERNKGDYLDPESQFPASDQYRQFFTTVSLPLGRGLLTDDRRASLRQAQLFTEMAEAEQVKLINKILLDAAKEYWQWFYAYYNYRLMDRNTRMARDIANRVSLNHQMGESSALDTVQAQITLQQRIVDRQEAWLDYQNAGIRLSNYLWDEDQNPMQIPTRMAPLLVPGQDELLSLQTLEELRQQASENHPELRKLGVKLEQLDVERKLAVEYLKPRVDLQYSFLNQPFTPSGDLQAFQFNGNYKFGVDFSIPIFLRKERAKLGLTKVKIQATQFEQTQARRQILNYLQEVYNQLTNTQTIMQQQALMVQNYEHILKAELLNLENGESDLFKINVQQEKLIHAQSKLLKLQSEYEKLKATMYWAAGVRHLNVSEP